MGHPLVLVLGGTRSGKSTFGLERIRSLAADDEVVYLATAFPGDPELDDRIGRHRRLRPSSWRTVVVGTDLPGAIRKAGQASGILLDGLTLWLSALTTEVGLDLDALLAGVVGEGLEAVMSTELPVVVVSDEIGLGVVPMDPTVRSFRDLQGIVHQRLAAAADEVVLTVAGLPLQLKPARAR